MAAPMGRRFWTVWVSSSASHLAEGLIFGALPVLAASLTRDARLISVTDALHQAGWLLLGLVSGVAADVLPRLRIAGLGTQAIGLPGTYVIGGLLLFATAAIAVRPLQEMPNRP